MSIFTYALLGHYAPVILTILIIAACLPVADYARRVLYRAGIDVLELRGRWRSQNNDHKRQALALMAPKQSMIQWANWFVEHQHDVEVEGLPALEDRND